MRNMGEVKDKILLLDSPDWPEGQVAVNFLNRFLDTYDQYSDEMLLEELEDVVKKAYGEAQKGNSDSASLMAAKAMVVVWALNHQSLVNVLISMPYEPPHTNKIEKIAASYGFELKGE